MGRTGKIIGFCVVVTVMTALFSCKQEDTTALKDHEWYSGGKQTVFIHGSGAFSQVFPHLSAEKLKMHDRGDKLFEATFNNDPTTRFFGLGPIFNAESCVSCHVGDGRGKVPVNNGDPMGTLLLRIAQMQPLEGGKPNPYPNFGGQVQHRSILGVKAETDILVTFTEQQFAFPDGEVYTLRQPHYQFVNAYKAMPSAYMLSARMPSPVFGLGLLEAVPESTLEGWEDPSDLDGDGIKGRRNVVHSALGGDWKTGRFGWKAGQPTVIEQTAGALNQDMGITSYIMPVENAFGQDQMLGVNVRKEISDSNLVALAYYVRSLAVPGRRNADDADVLEGKRFFHLVGCGGCHKSGYYTGSNMIDPELNYQKIYPYTDLLLHDMGAGLADGYTEFRANGSDWRTPPLWGIGLTKTVNGNQHYLHDGRARNFTEAIMWHGGEAQKSANEFSKLTAEERAKVMKFLNSL